MNKRNILYVSLALASFICSSAVALAQQPGRRHDIGHLLEPIRQKYKLPAMGGAILTSKGLIDVGATGVRKAGANVTVTSVDQWHLGSDTKAITATLIAALVEQKKLNWNTTIEQVFPELAPGFPARFRGITLEELLSHHAGLPANLDWDEISRSGTPREQRIRALKLASASKSLVEPGKNYEYSNLGYVIAGAVAERITNESWEHLITRRIFKPLRMSSAGFGGVGTPGKIDQPWGHDDAGMPVSANGPLMDNKEVMGPAGTIHCSLQDWAKFVADQLAGELGKPGLLRPSTYKELHRPRFGGDYAFGWLTVRRPWGGGTVLTHAGSNTMNYAVVWMAPARDFAVLVTSNEGGPSAEKACDEAASALISSYLRTP